MKVKGRGRREERKKKGVTKKDVVEGKMEVKKRM